MSILAIETTGPHCSVAFLDKEGRLHQKTGTQVMNHLQTLTPMIKDLMEEAKATWEDIDHIAVSAGPGSFTGIRIGVSAARALNQITGIPLISVGTLDAFGRQEGEETDEIICPILDARRNQVYGGAYGGRETVIPGGPYMLDELLTMLEREDRICFAGDGLAAYGGRIAAWAEKKGKTVRYKEVNQNASGVALLAGEMLQNPEAFGGVTSLDHNTLEPSYMRIPEAERKLKEKKAAGKETP